MGGTRGTRQGCTVNVDHALSLQGMEDLEKDVRGSQQNGGGEGGEKREEDRENRAKPRGAKTIAASERENKLCYVQMRNEKKMRV